MGIRIMCGRRKGNRLLTGRHRRSSQVMMLAMTVTMCAAVPTTTAGPSLTKQAGVVSFDGSTLVSTVTNFQPDLIYRKFPVDSPVHPQASWQLSFGVSLSSMASSINATLRLADPAQNPDVQVITDSATLVPQSNLYHNYDALDRFEVVYNGTLDPFVEPIDFVLAPDGFPDIPVRVHFNVIDHTGFPFAFQTSTVAPAPIGNIVGDAALEFVFPGTVGGVSALQALDASANTIPGWPFFNNDPEITNQSFSTPAIVDLDGDGLEEVLVFSNETRNPPSATPSGLVITKTLYALDGGANILWQATDDFSITGTPPTPAVADLDGDNDLDIVVGAANNLQRYEADGTLFPSWQVQTPNDIHVNVPVLADVDGDLNNGMEIVACTAVFGTTNVAQVFVWNEDGSLHDPNWPIIVRACQTPTVVELDGNPSNGREIILAVDYSDDPPVDPMTGDLNTFTVFAWHADGTNVAGWPRPFFRDPGIGFVDDRIISSAAAADLDGDGDVEVIVSTYGEGDPQNGNLFVFHHDGTLDNHWPQWGGIAQTPSYAGGVALGDLDGDNRLEIVTGSFLGVHAFRENGQPFEGFPRLTSEVFVQPMIADIDADGQLEIASVSLSGGALNVWDVLSPSPDPLPWPRFRQNPQHTGSVEREYVIPIPALGGLSQVALVTLLTGAGILIIRRHAV